jgi:DNA polymerase-3 subunit chi
MNATRVDFYLLTNGEADAKLQLACRLANKIFRIGKTAYIQTPDAAQADRLDDLLWTFDQGSFVPHYRAGSEAQPVVAPIIIGHEPPPCETRQNVLISLVNEAPRHYSEFERVADIVAADDDDKAKARSRFRFYRSMGCELETHDISV